MVPFELAVAKIFSNGCIATVKIVVKPKSNLLCVPRRAGDPNSTQRVGRHIYCYMDVLNVNSKSGLAFIVNNTTVCLRILFSKICKICSSFLF